MHAKKLMALLTLIIIALSMTGFAFANWTETLTINGTVNTATLNLTFSFISAPTENDPLNIATATVNPQGSTTGDVDTITLTVDNAYPSYEVTVSFSIKNIGTIPAKFVGFNLNGGPVSYDPINGWSASLPGGEITFQGYNSLNEILPVGSTRTYMVTLSVTSYAQPGTSYTFTAGVVFEQDV